ncbi:MAG: DUF1294 domain-containing protein [Acutalibacteraceae bacterium]
MPDAPLFFLLYWVLISITAAVTAAWDKFCAVHRRRRVPEHTLLLLAALGGRLSMLLTMLLVRHKTRKAKFMLGLPLIILVHLLILGAAFYLSFAAS